MQIAVELLIGRKVLDMDGESVGRIEEFRVERQHNALLVEAYLIGASAVIDRLSAWTLVRPIGRLLRMQHVFRVYEVPWQEMDLSDPEQPRLRIAQRDLRQAR
jgi:sporulation protein YlmC with PRC-barrel domain